MSHEPYHLPRPWSLEIFRLTSHAGQQRALRAFARIAAPGIHALGVLRDDEWLVIVDTSSVADGMRARRVVTGLDPLATRIHTAHSRRRPPPLPSSSFVTA